MKSSEAGFIQMQPILLDLVTNATRLKLDALLAHHSQILPTASCLSRLAFPEP